MPAGNLLYYALVALVIALIAAFLGFGGIAGTAAGIAQILFYVFLVDVISVVNQFIPPLQNQECRCVPKSPTESSGLANDRKIVSFQRAHQVGL
jgi:uncharacterized membrane protein YtjA (UPF0391 family)